MAHAIDVWQMQLPKIGGISWARDSRDPEILSKNGIRAQRVCTRDF